MTTKSVRDAVAEVERLGGEVERLTEQLASARQSAREAEHEIGAISARRKEIGLAVFQEDEAAVEELAELRARAASAEETLEVSVGAAEQLERRLGETKKALTGRPENGSTARGTVSSNAKARPSTQSETNSPSGSARFSIGKRISSTTEYRRCASTTGTGRTPRSSPATERATGSS